MTNPQLIQDIAIQGGKKLVDAVELQAVGTLRRLIRRRGIGLFPSQTLFYIGKSTDYAMLSPRDHH